jgi:hypothetical protein
MGLASFVVGKIGCGEDWLWGRSGVQGISFVRPVTDQGEWPIFPKKNG